MVPVIFMHIQKTAGTTLVNLLKRFYGEKNCMSHGDHLAGFAECANPETFFSKENILAAYQHKKFISGHFGYSFCSAFMDGRYSFTLLRDPADRILSLYYYWRSQPREGYHVYALAHDNSLKDFLLLGFERHGVMTHIWNAQMWQLAHGYCRADRKCLWTFKPEELQAMALRNIKTFSFVGTVENFKNCRDEILNALGIANPEDDPVDNAGPSRPDIDALDKSIRAILRKLTAFEQPIYDSIAAAGMIKNKSST